MPKGRGANNRGKNKQEKDNKKSVTKEPVDQYGQLEYQALSQMNDLYLDVIRSGHHNAQDLLSNIIIKNVLEQGSDIATTQLEILNAKIQIDNSEEIDNEQKNYQKLQKALLGAIAFLEGLVSDTEENLDNLGLEDDNAYDDPAIAQEENKPKLILPGSQEFNKS